MLSIIQIMKWGSTIGPMCATVRMKFTSSRPASLPATTASAKAHLHCSSKAIFAIRNS